MTIPNAMIFAKTINLANTKLSPALLLHCAPPAAVGGGHRARATAALGQGKRAGHLLCSSRTSLFGDRSPANSVH